MHEVSEILTNNYLDIFCISETKLDDSFTMSQFTVPDYKIHRKDRDCNGGGLLVYVKSSIPHRIRNEFTCVTGIEYLIIEIMVKAEKVMFIFIYKPPNIRNVDLVTSLGSLLDNFLTELRSIFIVGDINIDMQCPTRSVEEFMSMYNLRNIIDKPTCFKSIERPSIIDVILTNTPVRLASHLNVSIGVSDHHNIICAATKMHLSLNQKRHIRYRSMKHFNAEKFVSDLSHVPFHICEIFDEPDDIMWSYNMMLTDVVDVHAPVKQKIIKKPQVPYMNGQLRKEINIKAMLRRKFERFKDNHSWSRYKAQRNLVTSLKRKSIQTYFNQRCNLSKNPRSFWQTVKPFMSDKQVSSNVISLQENNQLITDQSKVCTLFNDYFINIANDLAECSDIENLSFKSLIDHFADHADIRSIKNNNVILPGNSFSFSQVSVCETNKKLKDLKSNKASGYDMIPAKLLKLGADVISISLTHVINQCLRNQVFPNVCKYAEVSPVYKKNNQLLMCNYRPVSILTGMSKVFEGIICDQLMSFFQDKLSSVLSAYRSKYSCNNVILKCTEDWRWSIDDGEKVGCVAMDLSRAFDSVPHGLLVAKLHAYGVDMNSCILIRNYLTNRMQRVKVGDKRSEWSCIKRGIPQGSLTGPVLFNIFINDLVTKLQNICSIYNYADDNTLSFCHKNIEVVKCKLEEACASAIEWFNSNNMKVNPDKFQFMLIDKRSVYDYDSIVLNVNNVQIEPSENIKLLGVTIDKQLSFRSHVTSLSKSCARQVNALSHLSHVLDTNCKLRILNAFVLANFNYCCLAYNSCGKTEARCLEKVLKRALKFVFLDFDSSYFDLLKKAELYPLCTQRKYELLLTVHKILNGIMPPIPSDFYVRNVSNYGFRNSVKLRQSHYKTVTYGYNSIKYQGALMWNRLPDVFKLEDFKDFKLKLKEYDFKCQCGDCFLCSLNSL